MKYRLRIILGELMFQWLEMQKPIIFRLDIVDPYHKLDLYKIILSNQREIEEKEKAIYEIEIIYVFENLWKLERDNPLELSSFWEKKIRNNSEADIFNLFKKYWNDRWKERWNNLEKGKIIKKRLSLKPPDRNFLLEKHTLAIKQLYAQFDGFRELINERGTKSQLIKFLGFSFDDIRSILVSTNDPLLELIKIDVNKEQLLEWLYEDYIQSLDSENIHERHCAIATAGIIVNILWLDNHFPKELQDFWRQMYRPLFLLFIDKLKENKIELIKNHLPIYINMLIEINLFTEDIYVMRKKKNKNELNLKKEEGFLNEKQELIEYNELNKKDQLEQDNLFNELQNNLNKLLKELNEIDSKEIDEIEDFRDYSEFIHCGHTWIIDNLINPKFKEKIKDLNKEGIERLEDLKEMWIDVDEIEINNSCYYNKYNKIDFECPEGRQNEILTINELEPIGYELIPRRETINNYIEFLSNNLKKLQQKASTSSNTSETLGDFYKINLTAILSKFINLIAKILIEDFNEYENDNKSKKMFDDWNKIGNIYEKRIDDMELKVCKIFLFLENWFLWNGQYANLINNKNIPSFKELKKYVENVKKGPSICAFQKASLYTIEIITRQLNTHDIHFDVFDAIITNSDKMRHFLCANDIIKIKNVLNEIMGHVNLILLENKHPEAMKIEQICTKIRLILYSVYVINPINSDESFNAKLRLVGPLLYGKIKSSYNEIKKVMGGVEKVNI